MCDDDSNDCIQDCDGVWGGSEWWCAGCTDSDAINYNSTATIDDGSCINFNTQISGCLSQFFVSGGNMTLTAKIVNYSSVTITVTGVMLLDSNNMIVYSQGLYTELLTNYYFTYPITMSNDPFFLSQNYKILWQFEYDGNSYQNIYFTNNVGGC